MAKIGDRLTADQAMRLAIQEARKGVGFVSPNPLVGCTIVDREHRLLAIGGHKRVGSDHAEIDALKKVADSSALEGATVYVTLEPCAHEGRTPSCAKRLAQLPIQSVVYGLHDPNPLVAGQGAGILRASGKQAIEFKDLEPVATETRESLLVELEELPEIFLHNMRTGSVFVALKVATSLDGMMMMASGESKWITGEKARRHAHYVRAHYDAVLIGRQTFSNDNPTLNIRLEGFENHSNKVVILDPAGRSLATLATSNLLTVRAPGAVSVVVQKGTEVFNPAGVDVIECKIDADSGGFVIREMMEALWDRQIRSVFVEGGAHTFGHFLTAGHVQRLHAFIAPALIGGRHGLGWTRAFGSSVLRERLELVHLRHESVGSDLYVTARLK